MIKLISPLLFLLLNTIIFSQPYQRELDIIPVSDATGLIPNTFSGGHNNLEHQFIDIDEDDDLDIFYLDSDGTFGWFENVGSKFNPVFDYTMTEIPGLSFSYWYYFVDIDADGDMDYFTANNDQMSLYLNDGTATSPNFYLAQDTVKDNNGSPIFSEFSCNSVFVDIDNDQDYDFISGNTAGTLAFYKNIGTSQNFNFELITTVWQDINIIGGRPDNILHGASSIDFVDIDGDSDLDLFWGDFFSKSLYVIENKGTPNVPDMEIVSDIYPVNSDSVFTSGYNMPRFADIDFDGDYDMFVSVLYDPTVPQSLMYYENVGTPQIANQILITEDYLKTLDVASNSSPVFVDIDDDDDLDLFLGSFKNQLGTINFLENTGTALNPSFYFADSIYFGITKALIIVPTFGDLDGDKDYDLIVGKLDGKLDLYLNSGDKTSAQFSTSVPVLDNLGDEIDAGTSSVPLLFDIDNDLDLDLIIGAFSGTFKFYRNTRNTSNYEFTFEPLYFDDLDVGSSSTPFILDYNNDGIYDLFSGNAAGEFYHFQNDGSNVAPIWNEITNHFLSDNFGGDSHPSFVDLDGDTDLDIVLGNVKGGLYLYNNTKISNVQEEKINPVSNFEISSYPNPFNPETQIRLELHVGQNIEIDVYNILGENVKKIFSGYIQAGIKTFSWNAKNNSGITLPAGTYFVKVSSHETQKVLKLSFLK
jgi:hypothetical protein